MAKKICKYCAKTYTSEVIMQHPICRDCFRMGMHLPKPEPKKIAKIYQDKSVSIIGWFWELQWAHGHAFTKSGAIRAAKRCARKQERGKYNKSFEVEV